MAKEELIKPAIVFKETYNGNNSQVIGLPDLASFIQLRSDSCCGKKLSVEATREENR